MEKNCMLKKFLFLFLISWNALLQAKEPDKKYELAISLGAKCHSAFHLQMNGLRHQAFPFDWAVTPMEGLLFFLVNEGKDFLNKENLLFNFPFLGVLGVYDTYYHMCFSHDFIFFSKDFGIYTYPEVDIRNYDEIKAKYERRIQRFFRVLRSNKKILFVRLGVNFEQAAQLQFCLDFLFPQLDYTILALDNTEEIKFNWGLSKVKNFFISTDMVMDFPGSIEEWQCILAQFNIEMNHQTSEKTYQPFD